MNESNFYVKDWLSYCNLEGLACCKMLGYVSFPVAGASGLVECMYLVTSIIENNLRLDFLLQLQIGPLCVEFYVHL